MMQISALRGTLVFLLVLTWVLGSHVQPVSAQNAIANLATEVCGAGAGPRAECRSYFMSAVIQCSSDLPNSSTGALVDCVIDRVPEPYKAHISQPAIRNQIIAGLTPAINDVQTGGQEQSACYSNILGFPAWYNGLNCDPETGPQIAELNDIWVVVLNMIRWLLGVAAYGAAIFIIWGGFKYIKSQGDPSSVANAKTTITQAVGGLFIALIANAIVAYVAGLF